MYCSACGVAVAQDLNYCKHCGAQLGAANSAGAKSSGLSSTSLLWAMVSVLIIGFGALIALMAVMRGADPFNGAMIKAFAVLSFLLMLAAEGVFIGLLLRRSKGTTKAVGPVQLKELTTAEIAGAEERLLPTPMPSITEHTTRTLEAVYNERQSE